MGNRAWYIIHKPAMSACKRRGRKLQRARAAFPAEQAVKIVFLRERAVGERVLFRMKRKGTHNVRILYTLPRRLIV